MNKKLSSEITITARYDRGIVTSPEVELALSRCSNNIIAKIKTTGNKIASYEYQIDNEDPIIEESNTHAFENEERGETHTVKVKITDIYGNVTEKEEEINIPDYPTLLGKQIGTEIPIVESGSGLYEVTHCDVTGTTNDEGFAIEEYRYAGSNPNNYIKFNDEDWRIIGLVNVMTSEDTVEQRVKIIRDESIGSFTLDYEEIESEKETNESNDWTSSQLMEILNNGYYYSSPDVTCFIGDGGYVKKQNCDFSNNGIQEKARNFIAEDIVWNIGGHPEIYEINSSKYYEYERGYLTANNYPFIWKTTNDKVARIGLMYPSDFAFATSGSSTSDRTSCLNANLIKNEKFYQSECHKQDWLFFGYPLERLITPHGQNSHYTMTLINVESEDTVGLYPNNVHLAFPVRPTLYLKENVKITTNDKSGSKESPYELNITE